MEEWTIRSPDDYHVHLRDGPDLGLLAAETANQFSRAIGMPNLDPPVTSLAMARAYRGRIYRSLEGRTGIGGVDLGISFTALMTVYLTDETTVGDIEEIALDPDRTVSALKLYPAGATTNSARGVTSIRGRLPVLREMARRDIPLLIHGEVTSSEVDVFDREKRFIDTSLKMILDEVPDLRVVLEHITTSHAASFVFSFPPRSDGRLQLAATITPHHLLFNRNALFQGGLRPHYYCLPVLKTESDRRTLLEAATSGDPRFFAGTDSAPHGADAKLSPCGCAGCFVAPRALGLYAQAFDSVGRMDRLEAFTSVHGASFYGLAPNEGTVTLRRVSSQVPARLEGSKTYVPFLAGEELAWTVVDRKETSRVSDRQVESQSASDGSTGWAGGAR